MVSLRLFVTMIFFLCKEVCWDKSLALEIYLNVKLEHSTKSQGPFTGAIH